MSRFVGGRLGPLLFLQIRNNSDRCLKAEEQLICKWKLSLEWIFSVIRVAGPWKKLGALGGKIFETQRKKHITTVRSNINPTFARGRHCVRRILGNLGNLHFFGVLTYW